MILKKLIVSGFKSFADKTSFDFNSGVTCIVGPNGCGKSNVVDAVKWVVGEQSAKSLRGGQMLDMIFNGSSTRKSSGMAQVELVIDNADGSLKIDAPEVTICRRLYRSGESGYLINGEACRMKDIKELLLDTGVGMRAYSVIEQGKVDQLLQANPEERRAIFEEAAGISKYKARRKEAERKLDRTQQNLARLQDITDELESRLRRVKAQASKARRYQEYDARLRELRASYAMAEYHRLTSTTATLKSELEATSDAKTEHEAQLANSDTEGSDISVKTMALDEAIEREVQRHSELRSEISACVERRHAAEQRSAEQEELLTSTQERLDNERTRLDGLRQRASEERAALPAIERRVEEAARIVAEKTTAEQAISREIAEIEARSEDEKSGLIDLLRQSSDLHNELSGIDHHRVALVDKKETLETRDDEIRQSLENVLGRKAQAQRRVTALESLLERERQQLRDKERIHADLNRRRGESSEALTSLKSERSGQVREQELLNDLEQKMEGVDQAVQDLLHRKITEPDNTRLAAIHGIVADVITTDTEHAAVIEAALARWAQHLVVDNSAAFLELNGDLGELPGRLRVLCADRLKPFIEGRNFDGHEGVVARAIDWVSYPEPLSFLACYLLGRTIVVDSLETALKLAGEDAYGYEFVTLSGQLVTSAGELLLGTAAEHVGLISRKSRLRELEVHLSEIDQQIAEFSSSLNRQQAESAHLEQVINELRESISRNQTDNAQSRADLQHATEQVEQLTREQPLISSEVAAIESQIAAAAEQATRHQESLEALAAKNAEREQIVTRYKRQVEDLSDERNVILEALTAARIEAGQLAEKKAAAMSAIHAIEAQLATSDHNQSEILDQIATCERRIGEAKVTVSETTERMTALENKAVAQEQHTLGLRRERDQLRQAAERLAEKTKSLRSRISELDEAIHAHQLKAQEAQVRLDELCVRVTEELGVDLHETYASYEHEHQDWAEVEQEISDLRGKIDRLGNINLDAIAEQEETEQRLEFLVNQRNDLDESRKQLEALIEELNTESRVRFETTFKSIRTHFQDLFRKLFGGGKADLIIDTTCEDILEAGIDIVARPPGKELQSIMLMSGGEKTMTTIALLMSIFKTHPSPFVFLDEVDAALDEANNERFNNIILEFLDLSQFIVITHSKRTMHIADSLYGVTMQEPGCSRLVSVKFEENIEPAVA